MYQLFLSRLSFTEWILVKIYGSKPVTKHVNCYQMNRSILHTASEGVNSVEISMKLQLHRSRRVSNRWAEEVKQC